MKSLMLLLLIVFPLMASAQNGTIRGTVLDALTREPLTAANIVVDTTHLGAVADKDGRFLIRGVPAGKHTLTCSFVGYQTVIKRDIIVKKHDTTITDFSLQAEAVHIQAVEISAYRPVVQKNAAFSSRAITGGGFNTEEYSRFEDNGYRNVQSDPLSTFSIDVDVASYTNVRRFLQMGQLPPPDAVRTEEMINYFTYDYPQPAEEKPFSVTTELAECPWEGTHRLLLLGIQGRKIPLENLPPSNLVFLIDVSGSMDEPNKLPLVQASLRLLVQQLRPVDIVSIVVYAGRAGLILPPTHGNDKARIIGAIDSLAAGGYTAGGEGILLAYKTARASLLPKGNNRIVWATDGDFNVGVSSTSDLVRLVEEQRQAGVYLSLLGFGMGNLKDSRLEQLADKGNGNYAYIDNYTEARRVLVGQLVGTLFTIAKDVKIQIEFNPSRVQAYRLIGYENRVLNKEDFNDDKKDAGELGSGHNVTALYELVPPGADYPRSNVDTLKYQNPTSLSPASGSDELLTLKLRYKLPADTVSQLMAQSLKDRIVPLGDTSDNFRFASAVAEFAMLLRDSPYKGHSAFHAVITRANRSLGKDPEGYRAEFVRLVTSAQGLMDAKK